ncbi:hypothetical protein GE061_015744 [Apolygus lucorum]|uniref:Protein krueppel n=1 Tax=Apolygus lucorum TaxID=248454 RepID=A0A6A4JID5_APOLU|nr:hypothetical protein GE061_015744 [Apolygus lucorum]
MPTRMLKRKSAQGINCVAPGCRSKIGGSTLIHFFKFPADPERFKLWCTNAKRHDLALLDPEVVRERYKVCSLHFEQDTLAPGRNDKLVNDAVPTIFNDNDSDGVYPCEHCNLTFTCKPMQKTHEKYCRARCKPKPLDWIMCAPPIQPAEQPPQNHETKAPPQEPPLLHPALLGLMKNTQLSLEIRSSVVVEPKKSPSEAGDTQQSAGKPQSPVLEMIPKTGAEKPKNYCCPLCNYATRNKTSYNKHLLVHSGTKPFKCDFCEYSCVQKGNLLRHQKIHTGVKPFECAICGYKCSENGHMKTHMMIHQGIKPFSCNLCDYSCTLAGNLKRHVRSHTGEKKYECEICGYRCREACNLRDHIMVHSGEKPHQCGECGYRCTQASNLKTHMRIHTGFKPYVCSECGYKTTRAGNLKDHMKTHTGERPFSCPICDYKAAQSCHLKNHMKTHVNPV